MRRAEVDIADSGGSAAEAVTSGGARACSGLDSWTEVGTGLDLWTGANSGGVEEPSTHNGNCHNRET